MESYSESIPSVRIREYIVEDGCVEKESIPGFY